MMIICHVIFVFRLRRQTRGNIGTLTILANWRFTSRPYFGASSRYVLNQRFFKFLQGSYAFRSLNGLEVNHQRIYTTLQD